MSKLEVSLINYIEIYWKNELIMNLTSLTEYKEYIIPIPAKAISNSLAFILP